MSVKVSMLALLGALMVSQANATLYMDVNVTLWDALAVDITDVGAYVAWALYMIWYSFAPLVAVVLGPIISNLFK